MEESCIICHDSNESLIEYIHSCGKYLVHQNCIDIWNNEYDTCFICRKNDNEVPVEIIIHTNTNTNTNNANDTDPDRYNLTRLRYILLYMIVGLISAFAIVVLVTSFVLTIANG